MLFAIWIQWVVFLSEVGFVFSHPRLWRFFLFFQLEYLIFSPYHFASKRTEGEDVFGFTPLPTMHIILRWCQQQIGDLRGKKIIDLGCGDSRGLFLASILFDMFGLGYEKNEALARKSVALADIIPVPEVVIENKDYHQASLSDCDIIYITWTTFSSSSRQAITQSLLEACQQGTLVISLTEPVVSNKFKLLGERQLRFSWGRTKVFLHEKN